MTPTELAAQQTELIRRYLDRVFKHHIDPSYPEHQELNQIHNAGLPYEDGMKC